ncbi:MAG: hypothetical protein OXB86_02625 [Bdellovibrionales bacterium]|nr:hypothetical protein [Bdellovibrionales bacterium]
MRVLSFLFFAILILACDELSFTDEETQGDSLIDIKKVEEKPEKLPDKSKEVKISPPELEEEPPEIKTPEEILEEETVFISEDMNLEKDTVIQNRKVVLDMITIKTFEYNLVIIAEEFISNHSVIQNFPEGQKAKKSHHGRDGGNIQIEAGIAKGELQLILNGEKAGFVSGFRHLSGREKKALKGHDGEDGYNAVYRPACQTYYIPIIWMPIDQDCWDVCSVFPTAGSPGGKGRRGLPGFDGKNGGSSGSFYLKAFELSDFHLTDIKNIPGEGSKGSKGSLGGRGGRGGENGKDRKDLCDDDLPRRKDGKRGARGSWGKSGRNGQKGTVCLEKLLKDNTTSLEKEASKKENIICY